MKIILGMAFLLVAAFVVWVYWWAPVSTCTDCDDSTSAESMSTSMLYEKAVVSGESEKRIYYAMKGALEGDQRLEQEYIFVFQAMNSTRQDGALKAVEEMQPSSARDSLLIKMKAVAKQPNR